MSKPRLLDLFSGAGGAARGYQLAGFHVTGVDIEPQPHYIGDEFHQGNALEADLSGFDAVHASPPCQTGTAYKRRGGGVGDGYLNLIPQTRELLEASRLPYVIENVEGMAEHLHDPTVLCGSMFDLDVKRHRLFETNWELPDHPWPCRHGIWGARFPQATNRTNRRRTVEVGVWRIPLDVQQQVMGIDWTTLEELSEAIPPAYTEFIGSRLLARLERAA